MLKIDQLLEMSPEQIKREIPTINQRLAILGEHSHNRKLNAQEMYEYYLKLEVEFRVITKINA